MISATCTNFLIVLKIYELINEDRFLELFFALQIDEFGFSLEGGRGDNGSIEEGLLACFFTLRWVFDLISYKH